jgi:NADH dehydrogenase [ubiquinone] 1 alpha subcomplex assembly factor 7
VVPSAGTFGGTCAGVTLAEIIAARIAAGGPISLAEYMAECLLHPTLGYYSTRDPFGAAGDFTTAPEISQMFGEVLGLALAQSWLDQGAPSSIVLAELGPGRGTLMADVLRATRAVPGFHAALRICLVEASPVLRARQAQALAGYAPNWFDTVQHLPGGPLYLIANEFFDALPIRQYHREPGGWRERMVGVAGGQLGFGLGPLLDGAGLPDRTPGQIFEVCPTASGIVAEISGRIAAHGGVAVIVDYGDWGSRGDTFQALKSNAFADPLAQPGQADLTAHVDFAALAAASPLARALVPQGLFLRRLGIGMRAARLAERLAGDKLQSHLAATRRLTDDDEMGTLFKVLVLYPADGPNPPGTV